MTPPDPQTRTLKDYRPQHDEDCERWLCGVCKVRRGDIRGLALIDGMLQHAHEWQQQPCTCGLDALLASAPVPALPYGDVRFISEPIGDALDIPAWLGYHVLIDLVGGRRMCLSMDREDSDLIARALNALYAAPVPQHTMIALPSIPGHQHVVLSDGTLACGCSWPKK